MLRNIHTISENPVPYINYHKANLHKCNIYLNEGLWIVLVKQVLHQCSDVGISNTLASI